ncbi:MAG: helix-turn-helix domain-containing protein [Candidatus Woesearchaeota archaeon]
MRKKNILDEEKNTFNDNFLEKEEKIEEEIDDSKLLNSEKLPVSKDLLRKLSDEFDLNAYETAVWLTLLNKKVLSAAEIYALSGVPRSRTYDILESLEKKGFIVLVPGRPLKYKALHPSKIIERMKINIYEELQEKLEMVESLKDSQFLEKLKELYNSNQEIAEITKINETLHDLAIYEKIRDSIKNASKSIKIALTKEQIYELMDYTGGTLYSATKKDIELKLIVIGERDNIIEKFFGINNVCYCDELKLNAIIIDDTECIFYIGKNQAMWVNTEFVGKGFGSFFNFIWEREIIKKSY